MSEVEAAADPSTRQRIVRSVLVHGPSTARELASRLELTPAAIRRHLGVLLEDGTFESREQRVYGPRGRGRPSKVFVLTDVGRSEFRQAYDELAIQAIQKLREVAGAQAVRELAEHRASSIEERFVALRAEDPESEAIELLVTALSDDGYAASIRPARSGAQLCQYHCPVAHVAAEFPMLCEVETQLFSRLLDSHVQRLATIAHGDEVCTTHIPAPLNPPLKTIRKR